MPTAELGPVGNRIAENLRRARTVRDVSLRELSDRLAELGRPILPSGIMKIEKGERRVDVDDLVAIVRALQLPSVADELMPQQYSDSDPVEVTPNLEMAAQDAWRLFSGQKPEPNPFEGLDADELAQLIDVLVPVGSAARTAVKNGATPAQVAAWARVEASRPARTAREMMDLAGEISEGGADG